MRVLAILLMTSCSPALAGGHGHEGYTSAEAPNTFPADIPLHTAEDSYTSDNIKRGGTPLSLSVVDRHPDHYADVVFHNELVNGTFTHSDISFYRPDGLVIQVILDYGSGDAPDLMWVIPPPGYRAVPAEVLVEEQSTVVVEIHQDLLG